MPSIDAWSLLIDFGCVSVLLLLGLGIRASTGFVQRLFVPASVIAGFGGLALGPNGFHILPLSSLLSQYPSVLITLIFAGLPFASRTFRWGAGSKTATKLGTYSAATMLLQWGLGLLFCLTILSLMWPDLPVGFGAVLASGFVGGHGTAAAVGAAFADHGWPDAGPLAMTSATVGIVSAIIGGMLWVQWGARKGATHFITRFQELPQELRTGLVPSANRRPLGLETLSSIAVDPLIFHLALIASAALGGFFIGQWSTEYLGSYRLPTFCLAFVCGVVLKQACEVLHVWDYIDRRTVVRLNSALTDVLVVCGIASINLHVVGRYALPLLALFVFGLVLCWALFYFGARSTLGEMWFEKGLYTWGWVTGVMAMALVLLRVVDPDNESAVLDDFALAYLFLGPLEVALVSFAPFLIVHGAVWGFIGVTTIAGFGVLLLGMKSRREPASASLR